jgi:eukaryotic-like serine/threonine-protein kinase
MTAGPGPSETCTEGDIIARKYRLESLLGQGGMGSVWRAFNLQLEVPVAIKLLRTDLAATDLGERLRVEARAAAKLVHPSIVRVFDIGESESGEPFIVMELLSGESLGTILERGALPAATALQLLLPIAEALSLAHSRGVVHRDIKPDNIFIAREGSMVQPKLLDFGIAKVTSSELAGGPALTQTGTLIGSPDYMSPEQAHAQPDVDERSDIWAFCVVLYEMLAGYAPFRGETPGAVLRSVIQDEPPALETVANIDPALAAIVRRGLEKDRDARPSSIFELGRELACWLFTQGVLEDVTGASLEAKWLGRTTENLSGAPATLAPPAQHEHATLVSVVHPSPRPSSEPLPLPRLRRRRWLPATLVASMAAVVAVWMTVVPARPASRATAATLPAPQAVTATKARAASQPEPAPVRLAAAHPEPRPEPKLIPRPKVSTTPRNVPAGRIPAALSLPRALPAETPPVREKRSDLLNPY